MKQTSLILTLAAFAAAASLAQGAESDESGFRPLFNGNDLTGWKLRHPEASNSWSVLPGGILKNTVEQGHHGVDLVTEKKFLNFIVFYESLTPENSNSGFYLRGRHEIQILGDHKK